MFRRTPSTCWNFSCAVGDEESAQGDRTAEGIQGTGRTIAEGAARPRSESVQAARQRMKEQLDAIRRVEELQRQRCRMRAQKASASRSSANRATAEARDSRDTSQLGET